MTDDNTRNLADKAYSTDQIPEFAVTIDRLELENRRLREALARAGGLLLALKMSVEWELAPAVKKYIAETEEHCRKALGGK